MLHSVSSSSKSFGAAYIRYSSTMQEDSFSLDAQLRQIHARAASDGVEIVKVYSDPATSAYKNRYRPGINQMLEDARRGSFQYLYVHKVDRLARRLEWAIDIVKQLQRMDVVLRAVEQNFNLDMPEGKLMFHLLGSLGEFYSDNLSKETHKGKYERAMQGFHNGWAPFGYVSEKHGDRKKAVPDPEKAKIIREMFERFSTGLYMDQDIANWMNTKGVKTLLGRPFTKDTIREMLQNPFYIGMLRYRGAFIPGRPYRGTGKFVKGLHEPLISNELFEECRRIRARRSRKSPTRQNTKYVYLLAGLLVCSCCGKNLRAQSSIRTRYYRDTARFSGVPCEHSGASVRADDLDERIGMVMQSLTLPADWQEELQRGLLEDKGPNPQREKARLNGEIKRMREAYKAGLYENDEVSFWKEIEILQTRLETLKQYTPTEVRQAAEVISGLGLAWAAAAPDERRELCRIILREVVIDLGTKEILHLSPRSEYSVLFRMIDSLEEQEDGSFRYRQEWGNQNSLS